MSKRASGAPRRPRNPVARAVRTPQFRPQVVADQRKRLQDRPKHPLAPLEEPADEDPKEE